MSSSKKRQLDPPNSSNKMRQSPININETLTPISPVQGKPPRPPLSLLLPHTLAKTQKQIEWEHEQLVKQHDEQQRIITDKKKQKNIKEGRYTDIAPRGELQKPQDTPDEINKRYAKADKEDFDKLDENKDWGLAFGGKRKTRKTKRKSKRKTKRKTRKTKRKTRKSKKSKRKSRKTRRK